MFKIRDWSHRPLLTPSIRISNCNNTKHDRPRSIYEHNAQKFHGTRILVWLRHETIHDPIQHFTQHLCGGWSAHYRPMSLKRSPKSHMHAFSSLYYGCSGLVFNVRFLCTQVDVLYQKYDPKFKPTKNPLGNPSVVDVVPWCYTLPITIAGGGGLNYSGDSSG